MPGYPKDLDGSHLPSPTSLQNTDGSERILIQLQDLVNRIENEIEYCKKQKEKYPRVQLYSDKIWVLNATKNYVRGNIGLDILEEYMRIYPKWDKDSETSDTKTLVHEAISLKVPLRHSLGEE